MKEEKWNRIVDFVEKNKEQHFAKQKKINCEWCGGVGYWYNGMGANAEPLECQVCNEKETELGKPDDEDE